MKSTDLEANLLYDALFRNRVCFRPCKDNDDQYRHACHLCGTTLEWAYMENRLYAIRCKKCGTVTLVKESNPAEAASIVGYEDEGQEDEDGK